MIKIRHCEMINYHVFTLLLRIRLRLHLFDLKLRAHDQETRTKSYKDAGVRASQMRNTK